MEPRNSTPASENGKARLLVVDDEPAVLKLVKAMLTRAQYRVLTCGSGTEALKMLDEMDFDCVITDAVMPLMTGYDLVKAIRRHPSLASLPVLMLTRKRHRQDVKRAVEVGVSDYVLKPIDEHLLLDKVELCLTKGLGQRHIFELSVAGSQSQGSMSLAVEIISISETDIAIRVPLQLTPDYNFQFNLGIFAEIGINMPYLKFLKCDPASVDFADAKELGYEARFAFVGVPEADLKKIRNWLQKEMIRRRK